jgi:hypothetical protein
MNAIFQVAYMIGWVAWILLDFKKIKENGSSRFMFWAINFVSLALFIAIRFNMRPLMPTTFINETIASWGKTITGGIMNVQTGD